MSIVMIELDQSATGKTCRSPQSPTPPVQTGLRSVPLKRPRSGHAVLPRVCQLMAGSRSFLAAICYLWVTAQEASLASRSQALPCGLIVGIYASHRLPERGRVIHFDEMGQFVGNDVIHKIEWLLDQAPIKADYPT